MTSSPRLTAPASEAESQASAHSSRCPKTATRATLTLRVSPIDSTPPVPCDGGYTCGCEACVMKRLDLVARGVRRPHRQPYEPLPREAAA